MSPKQLILCGIINVLVCVQVLKAQCPVPTSPPTTSLTDPSISNGETLGTGNTKSYRSTGTINSLTIKGGTLIVDGNLTISNLTFESGEIYVLPGASLTVGGNGIILNGNANIFNYGAFKVAANFYMLGSPASSNPSCFVNATSASSFSMPNQYFMIDAPNSQFINNGSAEIGGILTWTNSTPGSVVLNDGSVTELLNMYNYTDDAYSVPGNSACLSVEMPSQIHKRVTNSPALKVALASSFNNCSGCPTPPFGGAQTFPGAPSCGSIVTLPVKLTDFRIANQNNCNSLLWETENNTELVSFLIERSTNGVNFHEFSRIPKTITNQYQTKDCTPAVGLNYYRIKLVNESTGEVTYSKILSSRNTTNTTNSSIYPNPFINAFTVTFPGPLSTKLEGVLHNNLGQQITINLYKHSNAITVHTPENINPGIYLFQLTTDGATYKYRIVKN